MMIRNSPECQTYLAWNTTCLGCPGYEHCRATAEENLIMYETKLGLNRDMGKLVFKALKLWLNTYELYEPETLMALSYEEIWLKFLKGLEYEFYVGPHAIDLKKCIEQVDEWEEF